MSTPNDHHRRALYARAAKIEKYRRDFAAFCSEQLLVRPDQGAIRRLVLWKHQQLIETIIEKQIKEKGWLRLVEFKCRQHGGSTHGVARVCHRTFLNENVSSLIIANDDSSTENLFNMSQLYYDGMDADIRPVRRYMTKQEIVLENPDPKTRPDFPGLRSRINIQSAKNVHAGVGTTRNYVHLSEFCRFGNVRDLMGSLLPAIPMQPGTFIVNESAPFGYGEGRDKFREWCESARSGKDIYTFVAIYWWMIAKYEFPVGKEHTINGRFRPTGEEQRLIKAVKHVSLKELGYETELTPEQLVYRRNQILQFGKGDDAIGEQLFMQQYPHDYESGWTTFENSVFPQFQLEVMRRETEKGPLRRCDIVGDEVIDMQMNAPLWIWEDPQPGEMYDIGVDSSTGTGRNASAFQIFKRSNNEQVAEYENNGIDPLEYAKVVYSVGLYYNAAHVAVEVEGIGYATNEALNQMGYPNLYRWRRREDYRGTMYSNLTGWKTQFDTKRLLVAVSVNYFVRKEVIIHSPRLFGQMRFFCQDTTDVGNEVFYASDGEDDLVMAYMITQVVGRDERNMDMPMEKGVTMDRVPSLHERNVQFQKRLEQQMGVYGDGRETDYNRTEAIDPFDRLAKAFKNEGF